MYSLPRLLAPIQQTYSGGRLPRHGALDNRIAVEAVWEIAEGETTAVFAQAARAERIGYCRVTIPDKQRALQRQRHLFDFGRFPPIRHRAFRVRIPSELPD